MEDTGFQKLVKKKKNQDKVICNKLKLNSFEGLYE